MFNAETWVRREYPSLTEREVAIVIRAVYPEDATFHTAGRTAAAYREGIEWAVITLFPRKGAVISEAIWRLRKIEEGRE